MADRVSYGDNRWVIVYGNYNGLEKYAVNELYKVIAANIPYILTVYDHDVTKEMLENHNVVFIGTTSSNKYLKEYAQQGLFVENTKKQGFVIKTMKSPMNENRKITVLCGHDDQAIVYAVRDYHHFYVDAQKYNHFNTVYNDQYKIFIDEMPDYEQSDAPVFEHRGIWTWGHVIYDYKRYIDNMCQWKMNFLTLWNDFVPINAKEVVDYAHEHGVKIVWGYSWCWGEEVDPNSTADLEKWSKRIIETYEKEYRPINVDGMYFQTFTEHSGDKIGGHSTAELAADWVNKISNKILEKYPDLWIQFGLHGTYVKNDYKKIGEVDSRLNITWEDSGTFPYHHDPKNVSDTKGTAEFTYNVSRLRGENEDFGVVFKGLTMLKWPIFEHQKGPFILGESDSVFMKKRAVEKEFIWRYAQTYWNKNLDHVLEVMKAIKVNENKPTIMTVLIEDGMWEERIWSAGAMFAQAAWNPHQSKDEILEKIGLVEDIYR